MMFNWLHEPWRASPESWHLSRIYVYNHNNITHNYKWRASPESWHLSRIYVYNHNNNHTQSLFNTQSPVRGMIVRPKKGTLARGMARPGKAPTSAKELSPGVWLARGKHPHPVRPRSSVPAAHRVSVTSPRTGLACAPTGSYFLIPE